MADVNGDGFADLWSARAGVLDYFLHDGTTGTPTSANMWPATASGSLTMQNLAATSTAAGNGNMGWGQVDGTGAADVFVREDSGLSLYLSTPNVGDAYATAQGRQLLTQTETMRVIVNYQFYRSSVPQMGQPATADWDKDGDCCPDYARSLMR